MITLESGLSSSLIVLEHLRGIAELQDIDISVGTFTNCREVGLTFFVIAKSGEYFTWCVYEHRNSDELIINGKSGHHGKLGDLPYMSDSKYDYLSSFSYDEHKDCADKLAEMILKFYKEEKQNDKR